jgi:membrane fusion protein, multidrug efflux system
MRMQKVLVAIATAIPVAAMLAGCGQRAGEKSLRADALPRVIPVSVAPVELRNVERTVEVVGTLKGWEEVHVGVKKGGRILKVLHDMGDRVHPGEKLLEIDTIDAKLAWSQAQARYLAELARLGITKKQAEELLKRLGLTEQLLVGEETTKLIEQTPAIVQASVAVEKAQNVMNRLTNLYRRNAGTLEEYQNGETDLKAAKAARDTAIATARNIIAMACTSQVAIDVAEQNMQDLTIRVPEPTKYPDGMNASKLDYAITKRSVAEGQILKDGDVVMDLVIESPLKLWVNVPERHSADVKLGQPVRLTVASHPGKVFDGKVARINPSVDPVSRTFQVETIVPNEERLLRPGGFAKGSILIDLRSQASVVPVESVVKFAGVTKLFVIESGKSRAINIETGKEGSGWVEVTSALPDGAQVVTDGWSQLADGTPVSIQPSSAKPHESEARPSPPAETRPAKTS